MRRIRIALALWEWLNASPLRPSQADGASRDRRLYGKARIRQRRTTLS